jgi:glycosyltransferase involved in cell wall biosynthesis
MEDEVRMTLDRPAPRAGRLHVSVVIPVYRSRATLPELFDRLEREMRSAGLSYEVVLVDDDSPDDSWSVLCDLQAAHPDRVVAAQLMRNSGQHNALMCGLRCARGRYVVTMDDDLQHPPEEIPRLLGAIESDGSDLVYGVPACKEHGLWRNAGSAVVAWFYRLVFRLRVRPSAFRVMRRRLVRAILAYDLNYTYIDGLLAWHTRRIGQVAVEHRPRAVGRSGYSFGRLLVLALNLFTNFSLLPLQAVSLLGILAAGGGLAMGCCYLLLFLFSQIAVPGYASTIVAIFVLGGLQMLSLGVLGEYVGRLHLNVNRKPQYTVRRIRGRPAATAAPSSRRPKAA